MYHDVFVFWYFIRSSHCTIIPHHYSLITLLSLFPSLSRKNKGVCHFNYFISYYKRFSITCCHYFDLFIFSYIPAFHFFIKIFVGKVLNCLQFLNIAFSAYLMLLEFLLRFLLLLSRHSKHHICWFLYRQLDIEEIWWQYASLSHTLSYVGPLSFHILFWL